MPRARPPASAKKDNPLSIRPEAWAQTHRLCREALAITKEERPGEEPTVSLAFSCGKDSVTAWLCLRHYFARIVPVFWYLVPGLKFVERALAYYEEQFQTPILRLPHPDRFDLFATWSFQPPHRLTALDHILEDVPEYKMDELIEEVKERYGLTGTLHATGIRLADTPQRATLIKKHNGFSPDGSVFYPVAFWNADDVEAALAESGIQLPEEYHWYGRSFDGIMARWMAPIKEKLPEDYRRILDDFPLAELEFFRRKMAGVDDPAQNPIPMYKRVGAPKFADRLTRKRRTR